MMNDPSSPRITLWKNEGELWLMKEEQPGRIMRQDNRAWWNYNSEISGHTAGNSTVQSDERLSHFFGSAEVDGILIA
jgi:hypothetical protein